MGTSNPGRMDEREMTRNATAAAADAQVAADSAQSAASAVTTLAEGLITRSPLPPSGDGVADGALWLEYGSEGVVTHQWDADSESWEIPSADPVMLASAIIGQLAAGVIDTTEVTVHSGETGQRVVLDGVGLRGYDASNNLKTQITTDGLLTAVDATVVGAFRSAPVGIARLEISSITSLPGSDVVLAHVDASGISRGGIGFRNTSDGRNSIVRLRGNQGSGLSPLYGTVEIVGSANTNASYTSGSVVIAGAYESASASASVQIRGSVSGQAGTVSLLATTVQLTGAIDFTDAATKQSARNSLGLGNTTGPVPIANGGTGATTVAGIRAAIGAAVQEADFSGTITLTSAAGGLSGVFTLPSGMTQSNTLIHPSKQGGGLAKYIPYINWTSSTTFQIGIYSGDGTSASGNVAVAAYARRIS